MGTRSATSEVKLSIASTIVNTLTDGQAAQLSATRQILSGQLASGVGTSQANRYWEDLDRVISAGNSEDLDLYDLAGQDIGAGDGKDGLGQEWICEEVVFICIKQTAGPGRLEIMPAMPTGGSLTWMPIMTVANGAALRTGAAVALFNPHTDGFDLSDGVSHVIRLKANGGEVTYSIYVLGRHDDDESSSSTTSSLSSSSSRSSSSSSSSTSTLSTSSSSVSSSSSSSQSTSSQSTSTLSSSST